MFSAHRCKKLYQIKHFIANSTTSLNYQQKNQFVDGTNLLGSHVNQFQSRFCSGFINVKGGSGVDDSLDEKKSFIVSYLINSCGLSPEKALTNSSKLNFKDSEKPNSFLALLESHGFSKAQISNIVRVRPELLVSKEDTILPKLEFLKSIGMSTPRIANYIAKNPTWLYRSLENVIIRDYKILKSVLLTDKNVVNAIYQLSRRANSIENVAPNVDHLRRLEVSESCIRYVLTYYPETLVLESKEFEGSVSEVLQMGFSPQKHTFVLALHIWSEDANRRYWARCYDTYTKWGWSREDILLAFKKSPNCMIISQNKMDCTLDFLVNKFGHDSRTIAGTPIVLCFSLEKRIMPRCSVIQLLLSRGLMKKKLKLTTFLLPAEKDFLDKYVVPFEKKVPKLYNFYTGKVGIEEL